MSPDERLYCIYGASLFTRDTTHVLPLSAGRVRVPFAPASVFELPTGTRVFEDPIVAVVDHITFVGTLDEVVAHFRDCLVRAWALVPDSEKHRSVLTDAGVQSPRLLPLHPASKGDSPHG